MEKPSMEGWAQLVPGEQRNKRRGQRGARWTAHVEAGSGAADACARAAAVCGTVMRSRVKGSLGCMVCERAGPCQVRGGGAA